MPIVALVLILLGAGALAAGIFVYLSAIALLRPPRMTDGKAMAILHRVSPGDLELRFEPVTYHVRDEQTGRPLKLAGWWIPHETARGKCVVMLHGYADAKVGALAWAPLFHGLGWNILALDLRAHGQSQGRNMSEGWWERHDVSGAINELRAQRPADTRQLVLFGVSMGAAVATAVAAMRDDVDALVLDSMVADSIQATQTALRLMGLPCRALRRAAVGLAQWLSGADFGAVRPTDLLRRTRCPVLLIECEQDGWVDDAGREELRHAVCERSAPGEFWLVGRAGHLMALAAQPESYAHRLARFLDALRDRQ